MKAANIGESEIITIFAKKISQNSNEICQIEIFRFQWNFSGLFTGNYEAFDFDGKRRDILRK